MRRVHVRQSQECGSPPKIPMRSTVLPCKACLASHHTVVLRRCKPRLFGIQLLFIPCHIDLRDEKSFVILAIPSLQCGLTLVVRCRNADRCKSRTTLVSWGARRARQTFCCGKNRQGSTCVLIKYTKWDSVSVVAQGTYKYANREKGPWVPMQPLNHTCRQGGQASLKPV